MGEIVDQEIAASADDSIESYGGTDWLPTLTTLDISRRSDANQNFIRNGIMRWQLAIPAGATITACTITVISASSNQYTSPGWKWKAQAVDNAATPAQSFWDTGTIAQTTAEVDDSNGGTAGGSPFTSPDLSTILQEIIDRAGWASGNHVSFLMISPSGATPSNQSWNFAAYDHATFDPPKISVTWTEAAGGGSNLLIPKTQLVLPGVTMGKMALGDPEIEL